MPFLNFGGNKNKHFNLSDMNFFMKNRYSDPDPDPLKKALIWIRVAPKLFRVISKTKCFCYLRNAFSKFWQ